MFTGLTWFNMEFRRQIIEVILVITATVRTTVAMKHIWREL
jgi:hypothetical protein